MLNAIITTVANEQCSAWDYRYPFVYYFIALIVLSISNKYTERKLTQVELDNRASLLVFMSCFRLTFGLILYNLTVNCMHPISWLLYVAFSYNQ